MDFIVLEYIYVCVCVCENDLLNNVLKECYKIKHVICYSNLHHMFSNFM
jgi:hypothetical protein